jgi:hypothetical protein
MRTLPLRRALALSCLAFVLASPTALAEVPAKPRPTGKLVPTPSAKQIRQNLAERQKALARDLRVEADKARAQAAKCPEGKAGAACKQAAGKAHAKPIAEIRRKIVISRLEQERAVTDAELREDLAELESSGASAEYKAAQRKRLEAEARLRHEIATIQGEAELARLECRENVCRREVAARQKSREQEARKLVDVKPLQKEARRLDPRRAAPAIVVGEKPKQ